MERVKGKQGFASMDPERQRAIASKGGRAAHVQGKGHQFTSDEARRAGEIGGRKVSDDRAHMAEIGRLGGKARAKGRDRANDEAAEAQGEDREVAP